ncbi:MAG: LysM peptidoglycan-binding domain-containing protein [Leptospirillia bacterium]
MIRYRFLFALLAAFTFVVGAVHADELAIPDSGGKVHVVVKGDTLWDIAIAYLEDPFTWPKIWRDNEQVINPDLIYPGGNIRIPVALLKPEIREQVVEEEVEVVEVPVPKGTMNPLLVESGGYITKDLDSVGTVMGTYEGRTLMTTGDTIFLRMNKGVEAEPGARYQVVRTDRSVRHPVSRRSMGDMVEVVGLVEVTGRHKRLHHAEVQRIYGSLRPGDLLVPYVRPEVDINDVSESVDGVIVAMQEARTMSAMGNTVYLDRGARDSLLPGMEVTVMQESGSLSPDGTWGHYELPDRNVATLLILSVREATATAQVLTASEPVVVGNRFRAVPQDVEGGENGA